MIVLDYLIYNFSLKQRYMEDLAMGHLCLVDIIRELKSLKALGIIKTNNITWAMVGYGFT